MVLLKPDNIFFNNNNPFLIFILLFLSVFVTACSVTGGFILRDFVYEFLSRYNIYDSNKEINVSLLYFIFIHTILFIILIILITFMYIILQYIYSEFINI